MSHTRSCRFQLLVLICLCLWYVRIHIGMASLQLLGTTGSSPPLVSGQFRPAGENKVVTTSLEKKISVQVLYCLRGNSTEFIDQWEASLKSVLLNAPLDANLHIHILADNRGVSAVHNLMARGGVTNSTWRNPITISCYNVERYTQEWTEFLLNKTRGHELDGRVSLGSYYRLMASKVLLTNANHSRVTGERPTIGPVVYVDVDAIVMANLNDLWRHVDDSYMYQMSETWPCAGFMVVNMDKFEQFWSLLDSLPKIISGSDQALLVQVKDTYPQVVGTLPQEWDTHMGHGWRFAPHRLLEERHKVGMLHFNADVSEAMMPWYCKRARSCFNNETARQLYDMSWGLVEYYLRVEWSWVKYFGGESRLRFGEQGYPLKFVQVD